MTDTRHTPGPWTLELNNHPDEIGSHHYSLFVDGYEFGKYNDESLACGFDADAPCANAHLIEAAPDLLEALQDTIRVLVTAQGLPDKGKGRTEAQQDAYDKARAAIAKATP